MKKNQVSLWFLFLFLISADLWPQEYLVKVTNQKSAKKTLEKYGHFRPLTLSFGDYLVLQSKATLSQLKASLANSPEIVYLQPIFSYHALPVQMTKEEGVDWNAVATKKNAKGPSDRPQDPLFPRQWGMQNTGSNSRYNLFFSGKKGEDLQIVPVWEQKILGDRRIKVAVIDTGIDYQHPDLQDNLWINQSELHGTPEIDDDGNGYVDDVYGYNFYDGNGNTMDKQGHGTHCAGVIGAVHDNGIGVAGVMGEVQLVAVKFLGGWMGAGNTLGAIAAIDYAIKLGVDVMSNSWGGGSDEYDPALIDAIKAANQKGIVFVAAAGNESSNNDQVITYPSNVEAENVISVGAFMGKGNLASFSNYGKTKVHVMAPGTNILSTYKGGNYRKLSGTSMACPHVAGLAGLLLSVEPDLTPQEVRERLISSSTVNSFLENFSVSGGRVNAAKLLLAQ